MLISFDDSSAVEGVSPFPVVGTDRRATSNVLPAQKIGGPCRSDEPSGAQETYGPPHRSEVPADATNAQREATSDILIPSSKVHAARRSVRGGRGAPLAKGGRSTTLPPAVRGHGTAVRGVGAAWLAALDWGV